MLRFLILAVLFSAPAIGDEVFHHPVGKKPDSGLTEQDLNQMLREFEDEFGPEVKRLGYSLRWRARWESPWFGAGSQVEGKEFQIHLWGGMIRAPGMTQDALLLTICHEFGHLLGGDPKQRIVGAEWSSVEGQSDYWAARHCFPRMMIRVPGGRMSLESRQVCRVRKAAPDDEDCAREVEAYLDFSRFFQRWSFRKYVPVSPRERDKSKPRVVPVGYPSDQCRLDTFLDAKFCAQGACRPVCWYPEAPEGKAPPVESPWGMPE